MVLVEIKLFISIEEYSIYGGLGVVVSEVVSSLLISICYLILGILDEFVIVGMS